MSSAGAAFTLRAAWVVPVDAAPIRDGYVRVRGTRIAAVGAARELPPADRSGAPGERVYDLGDAILTPGLVNCHTHLELTCYAGRIAAAPFWRWLPQLVRLRAEPDQRARERAGVRAGAGQSLRAGVTCVGDISRCNIHWEVLRSLPLRKVCYVELLALADQPPRTVAELRAAVAEVIEDPLLTVGITPHAPYTVPAAELRAALDLARELNRPWCTHWAETPEERAFLRGDGAALPFLADLLAQCGVRSPGSGALAYLLGCARGAPPGLLAHYNYVDAGEAEALAAAGHAVVYCPRAHHFFQHAPHPLGRLRAAGVRVALGTDSAASNLDLALLAEAQHVHRFVADAPPPAELLRMITRDAAAALGLEAQIGTLAPGKQADLAAFPCPPAAADPVAALLHTAPPACAVWVAGQRVDLDAGA